MASIFSIFGNVYLDSEKAEQGIKDLTKHGEDTDKSLSSKFGSIAGNAVKMGTAVIGAASVVGGAAAALVMKVSDSASAVADASQRVGMSAEDYQQWTYAAKQSGVEASTLEGLMRKQQTVFAQASAGNKSAAETYQELGINIEGMTSGEAFNKSMDALASMSDETKRNEMANKLFGKSYAELTPLLKNGASGIKALKDEAVEMGAVMSNETVESGDKLGDTIDKIKASFGGMVSGLVGSVMPVVQQLMDMVVDNMPMIQSMMTSLAPVLANIFTALLPPLMELIQMLLPPLVDIINMLVPIIIDILDAVMPLVMILVESLLPPLIMLIQAVLPVLMPLLKTFASIFTAVLTPAIKFLGVVVTGLTVIFKNVFGGLFEIVKVPINWMIDGINMFIAGINKIKIPDWVPLLGGKSLNIPSIKKLQIGLDYVPMDNYPALLHKGESVLTAEETKNGKGSFVIDYDRMAESNMRVFKNFGIILNGEVIGNIIDLRILKEMEKVS